MQENKIISTTIICFILIIFVQIFSIVTILETIKKKFETSQISDVEVVVTNNKENNPDNNLPQILKTTKDRYGNVIAEIIYYPLQNEWIERHYYYDFRNATFIVEQIEDKKLSDIKGDEIE